MTVKVLCCVLGAARRVGIASIEWVGKTNALGVWVLSVNKEKACRRGRPTARCRSRRSRTAAWRVAVEAPRPTRRFSMSDVV